METPLPRTSPPSAPRWIRRAPMLLPLPALLPLAGALLDPWLKCKVTTGFIEYDLPSSLAEGGAYFTRGFHLTYSNPYSGYDAPAVYFQPQTLLLGLMQQLGLDPSLTFSLFGLMAMFFAAAVAVRFYREEAGADTTAKKIGFCAFWGEAVFLSWCL